MKYIAILLSLVATCATAAELPPELAAARNRYEAAVATATKPVRERYIRDLQQLKSRAMSLNNLELAIAVDNEIKNLTASVAIAGTASKDLQKRLIGTKWIWNNGKTMTFPETGGAISGFGRMTWRAVGDTTIEYSFDNGHHGTIVFDQRLRRGTINETASDGRKAEMPLARASE